MQKIIVVGYLLTATLFSVFSYAFVDPNLSYYKSIYTGFAFQERAITTSIYLALLVILFLLYFFVIWIPGLRPGMTKNKNIWILIGITCAIFLFAYPAMLSYDIFNYLTTAKVLFFYHENPYLIMPVAFLGDPYLAFTHAANKLALYAPIWILLTGIPFTLGVGNFFTTIISFKLLTTVFYLLTLFVMWELSKKWEVVLLFALHPLVLIETLVSGHNDIVMMFFVLFSLLMLKQKKYFFAIVCFLTSVLIKYATFFLLPVFFLIFIQSIRNKAVDWQRIYFISALSMMVIFFLSPLREEMYPWYAIWFLPFVFLTPERKILLYTTLALSFGLSLRYIPFMYTGSHFGITPITRIILTTVPVIVTGICLVIKKK